MRLMLSACVAALLMGSASAMAQTTYGVTVSTSVVTQVFPPVPVIADAPYGFVNKRVWQREMNVGSSASGPVAWCMRAASAPTSMTAGAAGLFPLAPAGNSNQWPWLEEFGGTGEPPASQLGLYCIASGGAVSVTAEAYPQ